MKVLAFLSCVLMLACSAQARIAVTTRCNRHATLDVTSGPVTPPNADAVYDVETDTLVRADGTTNMHYLSGLYDAPVRPMRTNRVFRTPPVGWMTWYAVKFGACEAAILENARAFRSAFEGYTDERPVLWIDWEWYHRMFNSRGADGEDALTPHAASYPRGLKPLAEDLTRLGFTPALWVAPQVDVRTNALLTAHPEWILASQPFWGGHVFTDPTAPNYAAGYLKPLFSRYRSWGFKVFKWDAMPNTMNAFDDCHDALTRPEQTTEEVFHAMIRAGREAVGDDAFILFCHAAKPYFDPLRWSLGEVDAARIGDDIFTWQEFRTGGIESLLRWYPLHNIALWADADNLVLRPEFSTLAQARTRVSIYALTGVPITLGDPMTALDDARIDLLRRAMPVVSVYPGALRPQVLVGDLFAVRAHYARPWGNWRVCAYSNLSTNHVENVELHEPGCAVWDFWRRELLSDGSSAAGHLTLSVPPGDTRVVRITPVEAARPTLIGSTRHITQGGYEVVDLQTTPEGARVRVKTTGRAEERLYFLFKGKLREVGVPNTQKGEVELTL